ncbi:MAG: helix-turn-helix domain-containing protein [Alphaproteobacteria bacterium]|nr:helix-turn-helix domain-containing protein [Alphaproteobacteria bacterium]
MRKSRRNSHVLSPGAAIALAKMIADLRLSQEEVGKAIGRDRSIISRVLGRETSFRPEWVPDMARVLQVTEDELRFRLGDPATQLRSTHTPTGVQAREDNGSLAGSASEKKRIAIAIIDAVYDIAESRGVADPPFEKVAEIARLALISVESLSRRGFPLTLDQIRGIALSTAEPFALEPALPPVVAH